MWASPVDRHPADWHPSVVPSPTGRPTSTTPTPSTPPARRRSGTSCVRRARWRTRRASAAPGCRPATRTWRRSPTTPSTSPRDGVIVSVFEPGDTAPVGYAPPITSDPPFHEVARRLLLPAFSPKAIRPLEEPTRAFCRQLIADVLADRGSRRCACDAAIDYAQHIPVRVIAHMLGVPPEDGDRFRQLHPPHHGDRRSERAGRPGRHAHRLPARRPSSTTVPTRRRRPDRLPARRRARRASRSTTTTSSARVALLLIAGIDTTWSAIGASIWHLAQHPEHRRRLRGGPRGHADRGRGAAAGLRAGHHGPQGRPRRSRSAGGRCRRATGCCCRSPRRTVIPSSSSDADEVILDRAKNRHAAFGLGHPPLPRIEPGPHGADRGGRGVAACGARTSSSPIRTPCGGRPARCGDPATLPVRVPDDDGGRVDGMRIEFDRSACQGHNRCYLLAPELFDVDDEGYAVLRVERRRARRARGQGAALPRTTAPSTRSRWSTELSVRRSGSWPVLGSKLASQVTSSDGSLNCDGWCRGVADTNRSGSTSNARLIDQRSSRHHATGDQMRRVAASCTIVAQHGERRQQRERAQPRQQVAQAGAVDRPMHVERHRLVLDLLGEVPEEQGRHRRVRAVEEQPQVALGPTRERERRGLEPGRERERPPCRAGASEPAVGTCGPAVDTSRAPGAPASTSWLNRRCCAWCCSSWATKARRLLRERTVELVQDRTHGVRHVGLDVGHEQRHGVGGGGELRERRVPPGVDAVGQLEPRACGPWAPELVPVTRGSCPSLGRSGLRG